MPPIDLLEIIPLFIFSNTIFLGLLFFTIPSDNKKANFYLGLFLLSIALSIYNVMFRHTYIEDVPHISSFVLEPFLFHLLFLVLYLHITINKQIDKWYYLIFLPGIIHNILLNYDRSSLPDSSILFFVYAFYLLEIAVVVNAFRVLGNYSKAIKGYYSDLENKSLQWLMFLFVLIIIFHSLIIISDVLELIGKDWIVVNIVILYLLTGIALFTPFWIGYNGFYQPEIFKERLFLTPNNGENVEQEYTNVEEQFRKFKDVIMRIEEKELYAYPKLTLRSLANMLDLNEKELSRLINECGNVNFYRFINDFRVEKFKELLHTPEAHQFSILGLANEAGFSSKSTFYAAFKESEGMTPKQYLDQIG